MPVVLYGCETWSHTLREEHRLTVFEHRVLRRISGPKRDEVTGDWRRLRNKELYILYSSPIQAIKSRKLKWDRVAQRVLVEKNEERKPLGRPWRRWKDDIKMDLREVGWGYGLNRSGSG